jgi:hypothetical protein
MRDALWRTIMRQNLWKEATVAAPSELFVQMQAGTVAALAAFAEALVKAGVIQPSALIVSLQHVSGEAMKSELGPIGQATLDGLIAAVRRFEPRPPDNRGGSH